MMKIPMYIAIPIASDPPPSSLRCMRMSDALDMLLSSTIPATAGIAAHKIPSTAAGPRREMIAPMDWFVSEDSVEGVCVMRGWYAMDQIEGIVRRVPTWGA